MTLAKFKNKHAGERVFLIGNGPSLAETPLSLLKNEYTMAMNRIDNIFGETDWRPTYYLQVNQGSYSNERIERIIKMVDRSIYSFVSNHEKSKLCGHIDDWDVVNEDKLEFVNIEKLGNTPATWLSRTKKETYTNHWSSDLTDHLYWKTTSMYVAAQLAVAMGFDKLYFVGCDLYPEFKPLPYTLFESGADPATFIPEFQSRDIYKDWVMDSDNPPATLANGVWFKSIYGTPIINALHKIYDRFGKTKQSHFTEGQTDKFYGPGLNSELRIIHQIIKTIGEFEGFECYNATEGGRLEIHERVNIREIVG